MTKPAFSDRLQVLQDPGRCAAWSLWEWQQAVRELRRLRLAGRLAWAVEGAGLLQQVPEPARRLLRAERNQSDSRCTALTWALQRVGAALRGTGIEPVLLKGAAYIVDGLDIGHGRMPSDLDILVRTEQLASAERALAEAGWTCIELDDEDVHYYREWSHELPPLRHPDHTLELDLHHNILPPRKGRQVDVRALWDSSAPSRQPGWRVLAPHDQILHSAAHLFWDPEPLERVRDLVDIDGLLRTAPQRTGLDPSAFATVLQARARLLQLEEPLALAVHCCARWLDTPIPGQLLDRSRRHPGMRALVPIFQAVLAPAPLDGARPWSQRVGAQLVLARYHWHRLPMRHLVPHLARKLRLRLQDRSRPAS